MVGLIVFYYIIYNNRAPQKVGCYSIFFRAVAIALVIAKLIIPLNPRKNRNIKKAKRRIGRMMHLFV